VLAEYEFEAEVNRRKMRVTPSLINFHFAILDPPLPQTVKRPPLEVHNCASSGGRFIVN
jgi:hypothetical protein